MMNSQIQCPRCGLNNKASHLNCIRCFAPLGGLPVVSVATENYRRSGIPLWLKLSAGAAVLLVLLVLGVAVAVIFSARKSVARKYVHLENAIRVSPDFNIPVTVDAGRYSYWDMENAKSDQEATPAAYTLAQLGLIYIHTGMYFDVSPTFNSAGKMVIDPSTGIVPKQYRHVSLELTGNGQTQSANWEPYENKKDGKVGWKVPVGERELLRVVEVMPGPAPSADTLMVSFTWKWKPNELGQSFDKGSPSYIKPTEPKNFPRSSFEVEINDSRAIYWGVVDLHRTGDTWEASRVMWSGPGGVKLSPNDAAEIDRIIKQSQAR